MKFSIENRALSQRGGANLVGEGVEKSVWDAISLVVDM